MKWWKRKEKMESQEKPYKVTCDETNNDLGSQSLNIDIEFTPVEDLESPYCDTCGSCCVPACCPPLNCAYANMVLLPHPDCKYGDINYLAIKFAYRMGKELYEKYQDVEIFDRIWYEVYDRKEND